MLRRVFVSCKAHEVTPSCPHDSTQRSRPFVVSKKELEAELTERRAELENSVAARSTLGASKRFSSVTSSLRKKEAKLTAEIKTRESELAAAKSAVGALLQASAKQKPAAAKKKAKKKASSKKKATRSASKKKTGTKRAAVSDVVRLTEATLRGSKRPVSESALRDRLKKSAAAKGFGVERLPVKRALEDRRFEKTGKGWQLR